ncbi:sulfotransferase family protein [Mycobacterium neglectum]|uniref:sulfotransferase family protein n=1 Tax=Mycobacterium neglectum TaxID=242737 RepID=UPI000BFEE6A6|nr:sulfotransferase [Mycobacterium neglectum]
MTWRPSARTESALAIYAAAEQDRVKRPDRYRLDPDAVLERVAARGEIRETHFAKGWRTGLEEFLGSAAEDARLNAVGARMALQSAIGRLTAGAKIAMWREGNASRANGSLAPPIVIVGGWRTGTTFLFRLLAGDPRLHAQIPAELAAPWLFAESAPNAGPELTTPGSELLHTLNPDMAFVHPSGPTLAEECVLGMGTDLRNWGFTSLMRLPAYATWLAGEDFGDPYARYREALQLLAVNDDRRFVLKAPAHTAELWYIAREFPGAIVIQIHRDIVATIASGASLFAVYQSTYSDEVDAVDVGRRQVDQSELWFRRANEFRSSPERDDVTLIDVDYRELIDDTASVLERIYAAADMAAPALDPFIANYHAAHPRNAHGTHRYTPQDFGLDADELRERFAFLNR